MIRPGRLHHVAIRVADCERSTRFYEDLLGMTRLPRRGSIPGVWYALGDAQLHLIERPTVERPTAGEGIDPTDPHVAIEVEDYEATKQTLRERDIEFVEFGPQLWIRDPDGYTVELRQKA
jgi:glyoxylase I family protein